MDRSNPLPDGAGGPHTNQKPPRKSTERFFFGRMDARKPVRKHGSEMCLFITYSFGNDPFYELINVVSNINPEKNIMAQLFKDSEKIEYFVFFALETADNTDGYVPNINISTAYVFSSLITILVLGSPIQHPNQ